MPWLELSLRSTEAEQPRYERALEDVGALSVTLLDADADTPNERAILEPGVGQTPIWKSLVLTALFDDGTDALALLAALDAAALTDRVDAIHLDDLSRLTMDYAGRFSVEMEYNADYDRMLQILEAGISKLESNQTGSIRLDLNPPILTLD